MGLFDEKSYSFNTVKSVTELDTSTKELEVKTEEVKEEVQTIQSEPFSGSDPGLVPASTTDTQAKYLRGDGSWSTPEGGSGGTEDYSDLANKPAIDGTTLDKDSTAAGLGLAKLTDIPTVPTKVSDLENDSGFITSSDIPTIPSKVSDLQNDSGFITSGMTFVCSTSAANVGKWINDSNIKRKVFTGTLSSSADDTQIGTLGNSDYLIHAYGTVLYGSSQQRVAVPYAGNAEWVSVYTDGTKLYVAAHNSGSDFRGKSYQIIVEYI